MKSKYYVISWKSLSKNTIDVSEFDEEKEAKEFGDFMKMDRRRVMICEKVSMVRSAKSYRMLNYGDYPFHKWMNVYIGVIILLGLLGIGYLIAKY